jgi:hypothetical protein
MITEKTFIDSVEVTENGCVFLREVTQFFDGDEVVSVKYHRKSFTPDQDISNEPKEIVDICTSARTTKAVATYNATLVKSEV